MLEKMVEKALIDGVQKKGGLCLKWVCPGHKGVPDRIVLLPGGKVYFVELKNERGTLSEIQKYVLQKLKDRGANVEVIFSRGDVKSFLEAV